MRPSARFPTLCCTFALALGLALSSGCASPDNPSRMPTATQPLPDDLTTYRMLTDKYTDYYVILGIDDMPLQEAARILKALRGIDPPPGLEELHQQAVRAYEFICSGKLLIPGSDSQVRAEAYFQVDWGIKLLMDYREQFDCHLEAAGRSDP